MTPVEMKVLGISVLLCILLKTLLNTSDLKDELKKVLKELEELKKSNDQRN
ncbi:hypothetical protein [Fibrobacter sp.]|uniref:hypothetical protein n=1 Tax=Fibrobacter sp. TaxID=35828 RepID=UPI00388CF283